MPSSVIAAMTYDPATQVLEMEYHGGRGVYRYFDVPLEEWESFLLAPSKGTYLNTVFKLREYSYAKVPGWSRLRGETLLYWPGPEERKGVDSVTVRHERRGSSRIS
jgi:hypothetical protein